MPTATALDIVTRAQREAGVIGMADAPSAEGGANGLDTVNGMLDSWKIDSRYVYASSFDVYALTASQQEYEIGPTAAAPFNVARPSKIINANIVYSSGLRVALAVIDDDQRMDIAMPNLDASLPFVLNYQKFDAATGSGKIWLWIKPQGGYSLELETPVLLDEFPDLFTAFSFPYGYYDAIVYSLAERFCTPGWGREESPAITKLAANARSKIESLNLDPPPLMQCDPRAFGCRESGGQAGLTAQTWLGSGQRFYR